MTRYRIKYKDGREIELDTYTEFLDICLNDKFKTIDKLEKIRIYDYTENIKHRIKEELNPSEELKTIFKQPTIKTSYNKNDKVLPYIFDIIHNVKTLYELIYLYNKEGLDDDLLELAGNFGITEKFLKEEYKELNIQSKD